VITVIFHQFFSSSEFGKYIVQRRPEQLIFKFPNGRGVSVVRYRGSYGYERGLYELAIGKIQENNGEIKIIIDYIVGYCSKKKIFKILKRIKNCEANNEK
jgi:hypothetical protein